jgi:hypothetical protein
MTDGTKINSNKYGGGIVLPTNGRSSSAAIVGNNCTDKLEPNYQRIYCNINEILLIQAQLQRSHVQNQNSVLKSIQFSYIQISCW